MYHLAFAYFKLFLPARDPGSIPSLAARRDAHRASQNRGPGVSAGGDFETVLRA